jgi:hypothetical protein
VDALLAMICSPSLRALACVAGKTLAPADQLRWKSFCLREYM